MKALLLDIDGVVCEPQQPISEKMLRFLRGYKSVYMVTGNTYTKAVDLVGSWPIFCNNADELRSGGLLIWKDEISPALPYIPPIRGMNNCMDWRSPRFVNVCPIGRYASKKARDESDNSWREDYIKEIKGRYHGIEAVIGGQVSVDVYSRGADKSRAGKWLNDIGYDFIFIGDKTDPGGNDYPLVKYCYDHPQNKWFKSTGPEHTMEIIRGLL